MTFPFAKVRSWEVRRQKLKKWLIGLHLFFFFWFFKRKHQWLHTERLLPCTCCFLCSDLLPVWDSHHILIQWRWGDTRLAPFQNLCPLASSLWDHFCYWKPPPNLEASLTDLFCSLSHESGIWIQLIWLGKVAWGLRRLLSELKLEASFLHSEQFKGTLIFFTEQYLLQVSQKIYHWVITFWQVIPKHSSKHE